MYLLQYFLLRIIRINNWTIIGSSALLIFSSAYIAHVVEPETFTHYFDAIWWVMTTVTTVGYGDLYPVTVGGRLLALFLYLFGIGMIGVVIGKVVDGLGTLKRKKEEGELTYYGTDHVMIIGWSKKAQLAVEEILQSDHETEIVIVDALEKHPYQRERVYFVHGDASLQETLEQAAVTEAKAVLVFADDTISDPVLADGKTLLVVTSIERLAPDISTTAEIMNKKHLNLFRHVKVDEFIFPQETISQLAVRSAFSSGISTIYSQLMSRTVGDDLYEIVPRPEWKTYRDAFMALLEDGATLISDGGKLDINQKLDDPIPNGATLYVIASKETYQKINA